MQPSDSHGGPLLDPSSRTPASSIVHPQPVAVGGIGGSGTRPVARLLDQLGYSLGDDRNGADDNLWFTLLFKRADILTMGEAEFGERVAIFVQAMTRNAPFTARQRALISRLPGEPAPDLTLDWLAERSATLLAAHNEARPVCAQWGWKEPKTHIVIERLIERMPNLNYVHVVRNGLDMAFANNQNQLRLWGAHFLAQHPVEVTPRHALRYWRVVHERILAIGARLGERFLLLRFDDLCRHPEATLETFYRFLAVTPSARERAQLRACIDPPPSLGRFKQRSLSDLDPADIDFVRRLGFDTGPA